MKDIEEKIVARISDTPVLWLFWIVGFFGLFGGSGMILYESSTSKNLALTGIVMIFTSFVVIYAALRLYIKYDLAK